MSNRRLLSASELSSYLAPEIDDSPPASSSPPPKPKRTGSVTKTTFAAAMAEQRKKAERRKARPKTIAAATFERTMTEAVEMARAGDYSKATASHLVAFFAIEHKAVYGVEPILCSKERYVSLMYAANFAKNYLAGDYEAACEFVWWAWQRERRIERWRRDNGIVEARRLNIYGLFSTKLLDDYRVEQVRRA